MRPHFLVTLFIIFGFNLAHGQEVDIRLYQKVPMRDGINLSANIYFPVDDLKSHPVILVYTPYVNDEAMERGMYFASKGYVFITLDLRGRGNSEGEYRPFEKDGIDGFDAVEWINRQDWCNGNIGMMGGSYRGMVQWMTLKNRPKALKTIVPTAAVGPGLDFPKINNIAYNYNLQWLGFTGGKGLNSNLFGNSQFWNQKETKKFKEHIPFKDWDIVAFGKRNPIFQTWISHPNFDSYWQDFYPTKEDYGYFDIPILTITGYFDGDQVGAIHYYQNHMEFGNELGKSKHYLVVGPWNHSGTRRPVTELGGLQFGDNAKLDMHELHLEWFDWTLKNKGKPEFLKDRVCYYVMDENEWAYADTLENISNETLTFYLNSPNSDAKLMTNPGRLSEEEPPKADNDAFVYDPLDVENPVVFIRDDFVAPVPIEEKGRLIYISEKLETALQFRGRFEVGLHLSTNVPDTDIQVRLYAIDALGKIKEIGFDLQRLRYREGLEEPKLVKPDEIFFCEFDTSYITALKVEKGSRLVLTVGCINSPHFQKNYNSGKDVSLETKEDAQKATIRVHHSPKHLSHLKILIYIED